MTLNEQELREHLEVAAAHASVPGFTMGSLISRIRRRRAKILGLISGSLLAVATIAVAVPIALSGQSAQPTAFPKAVPLQLSFTVAVNGQARVFPKNGPPPTFTVTSGQHLRIDLGVVVHAHAKVTSLWLGATKGEFGIPGRDGQPPTGVRPILAHTRKPLTPGLHVFRLTWTMPAQLSRRTSVWLVAAWEQQGTGAARAVAEFVTPR